MYLVHMCCCFSILVLQTATPLKICLARETISISTIIIIIIILIYLFTTFTLLQVWDLSATYAGPKTLTGHGDIVLALFVHK